MADPGMLSRLDMGTRPYHGEIESTWRVLAGPDLTRAKLVDHLIRVYGFEGSVEAALAYTPRLHMKVDLRKRARSGHLAQDLLNLGITAGQLAQLPQCQIAPFADAAEGLGWMYVMERSGSLHQTVKRHIEARLPQASMGCSYLSPDAGQSDHRWNELGRILDGAATDPKAADLISASAHDGFRCALHWFRGTQSQRRSVG